MPAALSERRRASSRPTGTLRKLVAVGIERLSFMNFTSVAAGPRIGSAPAGAEGLPSPSTALSTSSFVTRPRGPLPLSALTSIPCAAAMRSATGVALSSPFPAGGGEGAGFSSAAGCTCAGAPGPASMRHRTAPTDTVSSASTRISASVPATGAGTSASTLSVEISTSTSSAATLSPIPFLHSSTVPSLTESPICGNVTSTSSAAAGRRPVVASGLDLGERLAHADRGVGLHQDLA